MCLIPCVDPESFVRGGLTLMFFFVLFFNEGKEVPNSTISRPSLADDGPTLNNGLVAL